MIRAIFVCLLAALTLTEPAWAGPLPALTGPVVLTVTGLDPTRYPQGKAEFDMAMLDALDVAKVSTSSIWTEGVHSYTGPSLNAVTTYLSIANGTLSLHALNDYAVKMPASCLKLTPAGIGVVSVPFGPFTSMSDPLIVTVTPDGIEIGFFPTRDITFL